MKYQPVTVGGKRVGVYEIDRCKDKPYMMRIDYSETLRRGDACMRVDDSTVKLGRRQLQDLFEAKFHEEQAQKLQLVVYNQGDEPIENASVSLELPSHNSLYVASRLPKLKKEDRWIERGPAEKASYPAVNLKHDSIHVSSTLGKISTDAPVQVFEAPLRLCVGQELRGRKIGIRYSVFGSNLRKPAKGRLKLLFR